MTLKLDKAIQLALDHVYDEYRGGLIIEDTLFPDQYLGTKLDGWALFVISEENRTGRQKYVAVSMKTGETKSIDGN